MTIKIPDWYEASRQANVLSEKMIRALTEQARARIAARDKHIKETRRGNIQRKTIERLARIMAEKN